MYNAIIRGTGHYTPEHILTNADLEKIVDTSDEWIQTRTGIRERRVLNGSHDIGLSGMATNAARSALEDAKLDPSDVDAVIMATVTPDYRLPATATLVQRNLGIGRAALMDIVAACAGFLYGMSVARAFIVSGMYENVLVIGGEYLTSITNYEDRTTCVLFGDGAGAAVISRGGPSDNGRGILATYLAGDGQYKDLLHIPLGGSRNPLTAENAHLPGRHVHMDGREIFKLAVKEMADAAERVLAEAGCTADDLDMVITHQANHRIIEALRRRLNVPEEKVFSNIQYYGNTSSASVPIALDEARRSGVVNEGSLILSTAFGGGLVWGSALYRL
ncbi:MAG: beta-ketoacyl-ACP synthase III [Candidatus Zixiibacteriota bacterium]